MWQAVTTGFQWLIKRLEWLGKVLVALAVAAFAYRHRRRATAALRPAHLTSKRALLVRIDNRVGEALLTTPLADALAARGFEVHVLLHPRAIRVLVGLPSLHRLWPFEKTWRCLAALRDEPFDVVVNCGNWDAVSVTSAIVARLVAPRALVLGPANFPSGWLADLPVPARPDSRSEALQRLNLISPLVGPVDVPRLSFRSVGPAPHPVSEPYVVINPGGRLGFRRVSPSLFAAAALEAHSLGLTPLITWGPGEEGLADEVIHKAPLAARAPPTDLDALAALMAGAVATISNNTGPMHLAVAVGSPTLALFLHMDTERWGHAFSPHLMLDLTPLAHAPSEAERIVRAETRMFLERATSLLPSCRTLRGRTDI